MKKGRISMERALARTTTRRGFLARIEQMIMPRHTSRSEDHWWNLPPLTT